MFDGKINSEPVCVFKSAEQSKKLLFAEQPLRTRARVLMWSESVHMKLFLNSANRIKFWKSSNKRQQANKQAQILASRKVAKWTELRSKPNSFMDNRKLNTEFIT